MQEFELIAKTFQGLEEVLALELTELGANNVQIGRRMVTFTGNKELMYRANFCLRTAVRVLKPIKHFKARSADDVYEAVKKLDWDEYLDLDKAFSVDAVVFSDEFRHSKFVAYKVKDAIVDFFRERTGQRPNVRISNPDLRLNIHIAEDDATLSLDSSGESLHLRGYRTASVEAPINEVLAAGLLKIAGWDGTKNFVDPFCGSGTLLIEAALMAKNIYPGVFRKEFGFERWKDFDADLLERIYNDDSEERDFSYRILGFDLNRPAVEVSIANAKAAGVADVITVEQRDIRQFSAIEGETLLVTNPPYGERLTPPDVLAIYQALGRQLKHEFKGNTAWVISSRKECLDEIGLRPSVKHQILNGSLDCNFNKYQLFEGRLTDFRLEGGEVKTDTERTLMSDGRRFRKQRDEFKRRFDENIEEKGNQRFERNSRRKDDYRADRSSYHSNKTSVSHRLDTYADDEFLADNPQFLVLRRRHADFQLRKEGSRNTRKETRNRWDDRSHHSKNESKQQYPNGRKFDSHSRSQNSSERQENGYRHNRSRRTKGN